MRKVRTVYLTAEFDVDELLDELKDDELEAALASRGTTSGAKDAARKAIGEIRRGEYANAITTLEREFLPKWESTEACREAYRAALVGSEIERAIA